MTDQLQNAKHVHLLLDNVQGLEFHRAFAERVEQLKEPMTQKLGCALKIDIRQSFGVGDVQHRHALELAAELDTESDDLICIFPTDSHAATELQAAAYSLPLEKQWGRKREKLVCAILHQTLPESLLCDSATARNRRLFSVGADQVQMGRLQAEQVLRLLSNCSDRARHVLYISGPSHSSATRLRIAGAVEPLLRSNIIVEATHAEWDGQVVGSVLCDWRNAGGDLQRLDAVAAHNDEIAAAAKKWLRDAGRDGIPVVGMDGTENLGKRLVRDGVLTATVVQPLGASETLEYYKCIVLEGMQAAGLHENRNVRLAPSSFPEIRDLQPIAAARAK